MKLSPPKNVTWWISLVLVVLGILGTLVAIPVISPIAVWVAAAGGVLLLIATTTKGL